MTGMLGLPFAYVPGCRRAAVRPRNERISPLDYCIYLFSPADAAGRADVPAGATSQGRPEAAMKA